MQRKFNSVTQDLKTQLLHKEERLLDTLHQLQQEREIREADELRTFTHNLEEAHTELELRLAETDTFHREQAKRERRLFEESLANAEQRVRAAMKKEKQTIRASLILEEKARQQHTVLQQMASLLDASGYRPTESDKS
ncbi:MAG: hypothetical protein MHM6MM_002311 [Cercozoa sp. M6MM]